MYFLTFNLIEEFGVIYLVKVHTMRLVFTNRDRVHVLKVVGKIIP